MLQSPSLPDRRTLLSEKLRIVRRSTGKKFSAAKGYDLRHPISKGRVRTIAKYFDIIAELTARPHTLYRPKKGEKREAFAFTGQSHAPRFDVAIVETPQEGGYTFGIDRSLPKGGRFVVTNKRTRERTTHIPASVFLDENEALYDEDAELSPEFFADVIREYASETRNVAFVIEAGESHMWGDAGTPETVGEHLSILFKTYGAGNFNPFDPASHFIGNWFNGVKVYAPGEIIAIMNERLGPAAERQRTWNLRPGEHFRQLRSGDIGHFYKGRLLQTFPRTGFETATPEHGLIKPRDE